MLTCKDFLTEMGEFLDDSIEPDLRATIQTHVDDCPNCWVILDTTRKTIKVYRGIEPQAIPPEIHSRVMAAIEKRIAAGRSCQPPLES